jgi:hypothetical protein
VNVVEMLIYAACVRLVLTAPSSPIKVAAGEIVRGIYYLRIEGRIVA